MLNQLAAFELDLDIEPLWLSWFSGLVDGEGCFQIQIAKESSQVACVLKIEVRVEDRPMLDDLSAMLRCGSVSERVRPLTLKNGKTPHYAKWTVADTGAIVHIIIPVLDKYPLRSVKQNDFELWRQAALAIHAGKHLSRQGHSELVTLKRRMSEERHAGQQSQPN